MKKIVFISAICALAFGANVEISGAYAKASIANVKNSAVFFSAKNNDNKSISITSASFKGSAKTQLHTHIKENEMMKMVQVESFEIPANSTLELKPGSHHVMLIDLKNELKAGDKIDLELGFSDGSKTELKDIEVKELAKMKHHMGH